MKSLAPHLTFGRPKLPSQAIRDGYGRALLSLGKTNDRIVVLSADLDESMRITDFAKAFPKRFFQVGVAEQNLVGVAAGLAAEGLIPFANSFAVFSPGRSWDQLRVSVCYSNRNVKIIGGHAGLAAGPDGATHQALEDIAITRVLPNLTVIVPCDANEAAKATRAIAAMVGPVYLRLVRPATPVFTSAQTPFKIGQAEVFKRGRDVTLIACGSLVYQTLQAAELLAAKGVDAEVINCHTIKPLDSTTLLGSVRRTGAVVSVEDHQIAGGLGGAIAELLSEQLPRPLVRVGIKNAFGQSGSAEELWKHYGLTPSAISAAAQRVIKRKKK